MHNVFQLLNKYALVMIRVLHLETCVLFCKRIRLIQDSTGECHECIFSTKGSQG